MLAPPEQTRAPVAIHWSRFGVLRLFLAASVLGWGMTLRRIRLLESRTPVIEDTGLSYAISSEMYVLWWPPVLAVLTAALLLIPDETAKRAPARGTAALVAIALSMAAGVLLTWTAPVQAYRQGTLYEYPSWGSVGATALVFVAPAVIALATAVWLLDRARLIRRSRSLFGLALSSSAGIAALVGLSGLGAWLEADQGHRGFGTVMQRSVLAAAGIGMIIVLLGRWQRPTLVRSLSFGGVCVTVCAAVVAVPALAGAAVCVVGTSYLADYLCGPAVIATALVELAFIAGWVLYARAQNQLEPTAHRPPTHHWGLRTRD